MAFNHNNVKSDGDVKATNNPWLYNEDSGETEMTEKNNGDTILFPMSSELAGEMREVLATPESWQAQVVFALDDLYNAVPDDFDYEAEFGVGSTPFYSCDMGNNKLAGVAEALFRATVIRQRKRGIERLKERSGERNADFTREQIDLANETTKYELDHVREAILHKSPDEASDEYVMSLICKPGDMESEHFVGGKSSSPMVYASVGFSPQHLEGGKSPIWLWMERVGELSQSTYEFDYETKTGIVTMPADIDGRFTSDDRKWVSNITLATPTHFYGE